MILSLAEAPMTRSGEQHRRGGSGHGLGTSCRALSVEWKVDWKPVGVCACMAGPRGEDVKLLFSWSVSPADIALPWAGGAPGSAALTLTSGSCIKEALNALRDCAEVKCGFHSGCNWDYSYMTVTLQKTHYLHNL